MQRMRGRERPPSGGSGPVGQGRVRSGTAEGLIRTHRGQRRRFMSMTLVDKEAKTATGSAMVGAVVAGLDPAKYQVERRDGTVVKFKGEKIVNAITKAFLAEENL